MADQDPFTGQYEAELHYGSDTSITPSAAKENLIEHIIREPTFGDTTVEFHGEKKAGDGKEPSGADPNGTVDVAHPSTERTTQKKAAEATVTLKTVFEYNDPNFVSQHTDGELIEMAREAFHQSGHELCGTVKHIDVPKWADREQQS